MDNTYDAMATAQAVASVLGEGWHADDGVQNGRDAYIAGPHGERLHLVHGGYRTAERNRLVIRGSFEGDLHDQVSSAERHSASITLAPDRTASAIAREINRRLLPPYRELLWVAQDNAARQNQQTRAQVKLQERLVGILPLAQPLHGGTHAEFGSSEHIRGDVRTLHGATAVEFTVIVKADIALQVADYLADLYHNTLNRGA